MRIERAQMPDKIVLEEHQARPTFAPALAEFRAAPQLLWMEFEECCRLLQDKGSHRIHAPPSFAWR